MVSDKKPQIPDIDKCNKNQKQNMAPPSWLSRENRSDERKTASNRDEKECQI
jgi:hypothetical protein